MTTSESKGRFFTNELIRITNRVANWNALLRTHPQTDVDPPRFLDRTVICGGQIVSPPPGAIPCNDLKPQATEFRIM